MSRLTEYLFATFQEDRLSDEEISQALGGGLTADLEGLTEAKLIAAFKAGQISPTAFGNELRRRGKGQEAIYQIIREALAPEEAKLKGLTKEDYDAFLKVGKDEAGNRFGPEEYKAALAALEYDSRKIARELAQAQAGGKSRAQQQAEKRAAEQAASAEEQAAIAAYRQQRPGSDLFALPGGGYREEYLGENGQGFAQNIVYDPSTGTVKSGGATPSGSVAARKGIAFRDTLTPGQIAVLEAGGMPAWTKAFQDAYGRAPTPNELSAGGQSISRDPDLGYLKNLGINQLFPGRIFSERENVARSLRGPGQVGADALLTPFSEEEQLRYNAFGPGGLPARSTTSQQINPVTGQYEGQPVANQYSQSSRLNPETDKFENIVPGADVDLLTLQLLQNPQQMAELPEQFKTPIESVLSGGGRLGNKYDWSALTPRNSPFYRGAQPQSPQRRGTRRDVYAPPDLSTDNFMNRNLSVPGFAQGGGITTAGPMGLTDLRSGQVKAIIGEQQPERLIVDSNAQTPEIEAPGGQGYWSGQTAPQPMGFAGGGQATAGAAGAGSVNSYQDPLSMPLIPRMPNAAFKAMAEMRKRRRGSY